MHKKSFLLGILFTISLYIIVNIILVINNTNKIYVKNIESYSKIVNNIKTYIENIKDEECKVEFNNMLNFINKTHYQENVNVEKFYQDYYQDKTFLMHFDDLVNTCNIKNDEYDPIYILALASTNFPESIKYQYNLKHEFIFKDYYNRKLLDKEKDEIGTYTTKVLELRVISELLELIK